METYTQEHLNSVAVSYEEEVKRLLALKANYVLQIGNLKNQISVLQKENAELKKGNQSDPPTTTPLTND